MQSSLSDQDSPVIMPAAVLGEAVLSFLGLGIPTTDRK
jgi:ABC-type dipeptide/oligopeptide/nickel transport system permease subunit